MTEYYVMRSLFNLFIKIKYFVDFFFSSTKKFILPTKLIIINLTKKNVNSSHKKRYHFDFVFFWLKVNSILALSKLNCYFNHQRFFKVAFSFFFFFYLFLRQWFLFSTKFVMQLRDEAIKMDLYSNINDSVGIFYIFLNTFLSVES